MVDISDSQFQEKFHAEAQKDAEKNDLKVDAVNFAVTNL
jgi:hypothetical protein